MIQTIRESIEQRRAEGLSTADPDEMELYLVRSAAALVALPERVECTLFEHRALTFAASQLLRLAGKSRYADPHELVERIVAAQRKSAKSTAKETEE